MTIVRQRALSGLVTRAIAAFFVVLCSALVPATAEDTPPAWGGIPQAIVVRSTENVTEGGWVWILNEAKASGISRIYLLVKQDENEYASERTGRTLAAGELLVSLPGEKTAEGWENSEWLQGLLRQAHDSGIEVFAWFPVFQDAVLARDFAAASYSGSGAETFVDPAVPAVRARIEAIIAKLASTYAFDGIALDWIRYNKRPDGAKGPLAERFRMTTGKDWSEDLMKEPLMRATWDDLRASTVASWIGDLIATYRKQRPDLKWGGFVLPWMFKEVAQSYRHLGAAGLDDLMPMIYWKDFNETAQWTREVLKGATFKLEGATQFRPTFDLNDSEASLLDGISELGTDRIAGHVWYLHGTWGAPEFARLKSLSTQWVSAGGPTAALNADAELDPPLAEVPPYQPARLEPAVFSPDVSTWMLVCLGELYKRGALDGREGIVPVLAFHRFKDGPRLSGGSDWVTSTEYLDDMFAYLKAVGFNTVPASSALAYMMSDDPNVLPQRPIVLSIDDGSATIQQHFHPRATANGASYVVSLITSLVKDQDAGADFGDYSDKDTVLTARQVRELAQSGRVEFLSHSDNLHFYAPEDEDAKSSGPAATTHFWLKAKNRRETQAEWHQRVFNDLAHSRRQLGALGLSSPPILTWPYGATSGTTKTIANSTGFSGFFAFGGSQFMVPLYENDTMSRLAIMRADESLPLAMPSQKLVQQQWWLAFLKICWQSGSPELIEAALEQLEGAQKTHPQAEAARAALDVLQGKPGAARARIEAMRRAYPHDTAVHSALDDVSETYEPSL